MSFLAFPLRLKKTFLERCDEREAVLGLLRAMARTPNGSWRACPHFGVRDLFEQGRRRRELPERAVEEMNRALEDLGMTRYRVLSIEREAPADRDTDSYAVTLVSTDAEGETFSAAF